MNDSNHASGDYDLSVIMGSWMVAIVVTSADAISAALGVILISIVKYG